MGGEKCHLRFASASAEGSPPRGRGKVDSWTLWRYTVRITPAWAGKRQERGCGGTQHRDHPRVGGEKCIRLFWSVSLRGSPPRGRGKGSFSSCRKVGCRITPAWAGKSVAYITVIWCPWDHPRMGGEKAASLIWKVVRSGSPPHGRGKAHFTKLTSTARRITPAWAGKSGGKGGCCTPL